MWQSGHNRDDACQSDSPMTTIADDLRLSSPLDLPPPGDSICAYPLPRDTPRSSVSLDVRPLDQHIQAALDKLRKLSIDICTASKDNSSALSEQVASLLAALAPVRVQAAKLEPETLTQLVKQIERSAPMPN